MKEIEKVKAKIKKDVNDYTKKLKENGIDYCINNYYTIALTMNFLEGLAWSFEEIYDNGEEDELLIAYDEKVISRIINYKGNIGEYLTENFMSFNHPERYNVFASWSEDFYEVVDYILKNCEWDEVELLGFYF